MKTSRVSAGLGAVCVLAMSAASYGAAIKDVVVSGPFQAWASDGVYDSDGGLTLANPTPAPNAVDGFLAGDISAPGGNLELSDESFVSFSAWQGSTTPPTATTAIGNFGTTTPDIILSSVTAEDWRANSYRLAADYIIAAAASVGITITDSDILPGQLVAFVEAGIPELGGVSMAYQISDPNISFVEMISPTEVDIGLSALLDGSAFLSLIVPPGVTLSPGDTASEVVMVTWNGETEAFFGFECVDSRQDAGDGANHATSSYSCTVGSVPEPGTYALLALGIAGIGFSSRKRSKT